MSEEFVSKIECAANVDKLSTSVNGVAEEVNKQGLALYGPDGRGGIVSDIGVIKGDNKLMAKSLKNIEKSVNGNGTLRVAENEISAKRLMAYAGLLSSFVAALAAVIVATLANVGS